MNRELLPSRAFLRASRKYAKNNPAMRQALQVCLKLLAADAFDPRLKTHKLQGNLSGVWACSAERNLRILFEFVSHNGKEAISLLTVGTHDEVY